jgi:hypothetical protein
MNTKTPKAAESSPPNAAPAPPPPRRSPAEHLRKYRFQPGTCPNPGGRPKSLATLIRGELGNGTELVERMIRIFRGEEPGFTGARERLEAGKWLSDRGWGRAPETQIQIQAEAAEVEGASEIADSALSDLAAVLHEAAPSPEGVGDADAATAAAVLRVLSEAEEAA